MRLPGLVLAISLLSGAAQAQYGGGYGTGGNPLLGAWSTQVPLNDGGTVFQTQYFAPDGSFTVTGRFPNGMLTRMWGQYQLSPSGPNQWRLDRQVAGSLPTQTCAQANGGPVNCRPFNGGPHGAGSDTVFLAGPGSVVISGSTLTRDPDPQLARAQVPAQWLTTLNIPVPQLPYGGGGGGGGYQPQYNPHHWDNDNNLQQERICSINGGRIEVVGGAERCIN